MSDNHYQADTIYKTIFRRFDEGELQILCFHLNIDCDNLGGSRLDNKIVELILYFERRNSLATLVRVIKDIRKDILWNDTEVVSFPFSSYYRVRYNSRDETLPMLPKRWEYYSTVGEHPNRIKWTNREVDGLATLGFTAYKDEHIGANKHIPSVFGRVDFEYKAVYSGAEMSNTVIYVIPAQLNWLDSAPHQLEQGTRVSFIIPEDHIGDGVWHRHSIDFDFRYYDDVFYAIFAPRINEGCLYTGPAHFMVSDFQIYAP